MTVDLAIEIRPAEPADSSTLVGWLEDERLEAAFVPEQFFVVEAHRAQLPSARLPVGDDEGCCIVGCARLKPLPDGASELGSVVVHPACRGEGIGRALVGSVLDGADGPVHALCLAEGFFEQLGFQPVETPHPALAEKAKTCCADQPMVPMVWRPHP